MKDNDLARIKHFASTGDSLSKALLQAVGVEYTTLTDGDADNYLNFNMGLILVTTDGSGSWNNITLEDGAYDGQKTMIVFHKRPSEDDHLYLDLSVRPNGTIDITNPGDGVELIWMVDHWYLSHFLNSATWD